MESAPSVDLALSGADLSWVEPPEPKRLVGMHRRAVVAAALQVPYPVFSLVVIGGSYLGVVDPGSVVVLAGEVLLSLPGLVAFMYWFYGAYRLAQDMSAYPLDTTPGWGVAQFFIPIVSLFMPYQRMREIEEVNASGASGTLLDEPAGGHLLALWWAAWVAGMILGGIVGGVEGVDTSGEAVVTVGLLAVGSGVLSNVMTALVALHIDAGQQALSQALWDAEPLAPEEWA